MNTNAPVQESQPSSTSAGKEYEVRRYTAYFRGWCQTFGEHEKDFQRGSEINWLLGHDQIGLILADEIVKVLYRELLGQKQRAPTLVLGESYVQLGDVVLSTVEEKIDQGARALRALLKNPAPLHMYLTYHLFYPSGTRIVTFSRKAPLGILYKEIAPLQVRLVQAAAKPASS